MVVVRYSKRLFKKFLKVFSVFVPTLRYCILLLIFLQQHFPAYNFQFAFIVFVLVIMDIGKVFDMKTVLKVSK